MTFNDLINKIRNLSLDEKIEIKKLLKNLLLMNEEKKFKNII
jgi:hypothetical protein